MGELNNSMLQMTVGKKETIRVVFKKTILLRQYETEVFELESTVEVDHPLTGAERAVIQTIVMCNLEMAAFANLMCKGTISKEEYETRITMLEYNLRSIAQKAASLVPGFDLKDYLILQGQNPQTGATDEIKQNNGEIQVGNG